MGRPGLRAIAALGIVVLVGSALAALALGAVGAGRDHPAGRRARAAGRTVGPSTTRRPARARPRPRHAAHAARAPCPSGRPIHERTITRRRWLRHVAITEYYSTPERWFSGRFVRVPGLPGRHRVDWLYSARGVAMQGDGIGLDGHHDHIDALGHAAWVNARGHRTVPGRCASRWSRGMPVWLQGGWRNAAGAPTFPLSRGGWSNGRGDHDRTYAGVTFARGSSMPLHPYHTLAVDPRLIPRGSRVFIPAYRHHGGGWFVAQDTGGAIIGRHVDVYRPPPARSAPGGRYLRGQRIYVVPPGR